MWAIDWPNLAAVTAVVGACSAGGLAILRALLVKSFVSRREHGEVLERVKETERKLAAVPTHGDFNKILERLAEGAARFEGLTAQLIGIRKSIERTEVQIDMLARAQLERENRS